MRTKLDHIYGSIGGASSTELETLKNQVTSLSNVAAKVNLTNTFTTNQKINGYVQGSKGFWIQATDQRISTMVEQGAKKISNWFIQNNMGYRNHLTWDIIFRYQSQNDNQAVTLSRWEFQDTNSGLVWTLENNKLTFNAETEINNVKTPTTNLQAANKQYVDSKALPAFTLFQNWTGDFKAQDLTWGVQGTITTTGIYEIKIALTYNNFTYITNDTFHVDSLTGRYNSESHWFNFANQNSAGAPQNAPNSGFWVAYSTDKKIKICKFGSNQPTANTNVKIYIRKIG